MPILGQKGTSSYDLILFFWKMIVWPFFWNVYTQNKQDKGEKLLLLFNFAATKYFHKLSFNDNKLSENKL